MEGSNPHMALLNAAMYGDAVTVKNCLNTGSSKYINVQDSYGMTPVIFAARAHGDSVECVKLLLNAGADVNTKNRNVLTALSSAAESGNTGCVQVLLDASGSKQVNISDNIGQTSIMLAARSSGDNVECLQLLLNAGADTDTHNMYGSTALHYAAESGNARCMQALLHAGGSKHVNASDHQGQTPIMLAARAERNNVECVKLLLNAGADVHTQDKFGSTLLAFAAQQGSVECMQSLLDAGAHKYIGSSNLQGQTLLMLASRSLGDNVQCVEKLLNLGACVHGQDSGGRTALHFASNEGNSRCVQALLGAGSDHYVNLSDFHGTTPLMLTARSMGDNVECLKILLHAGAQSDAVDDSGDTALACTGKFGNVKCLQTLLDAGCERLVNVSNKSGQTPLMLAAGADRDYIECVRTLLNAGACSDVKDNYGSTAVAYAADVSVKCLQALLDAGSINYLNTPVKNRQTLVMLAASSPTDDTACLKTLLEAGADINVTDVSGHTALALAATCGNIDCVEVLLDTNDNKHVNISNMIGQTPLMLLAKSCGDCVEHLQKLLNSGADVNVTDNKGYTALAYAAESGNICCVQALIDAGGCQDINSSTMTGHTLLMLASKSRGDYDQSLKNLLKLGADINMKDNDGCTGVMHAAAGGNPNCVRVLLEAGGRAHVNSGNNEGQTPLMLAAKSEGDSVECLQELLTAGADNDVRDNQGYTALAHAAAGGNTNCVQALLDVGCNKHVNAINNKHQTPLMLAAKFPRDNFQCLQKLLDVGADVDIQDDDGYTALAYAADSGNTSCVQILLDMGCQKCVNTTNVHGQTLLMLAARSYSDNSLCLLKLLKAGAELEMKDDKGYTALAFAAEHGNLSCVQTLIDAGADVNITDKDLCTPLMLTGGHYLSAGCIRVLLKAGADINLRDSAGRTVIDKAVEHPEYVRLYKAMAKQN